MRIGKQELAMLEEISLGDQFFGFMTSATSTRSMYRNARERARARVERSVQQRQECRLRRLSEKNLVKLVGPTRSRRWKLTAKGKRELRRRTIDLSQMQQTSWDGKWRFVMFDIPCEHNRYRHDLRRLLTRCGFVSTQHSVYAFPYRVQELYAYLAEHKVLGAYVHVIEGDYEGDDSRLRERFNL